MPSTTTAPRRNEKQFLIRDGLLERALGGAVSQARTGMAGVANSRSSAWNQSADRPNGEPEHRAWFEHLVRGELVGQYRRHGVLPRDELVVVDRRQPQQVPVQLRTRNLIEDGELTSVVRNPSYRGISRNFWRSLVGVGDGESFRVMGVPNCGKGEPNQVIWVGHASPHCLFTGIDVFGGES